MPAGRVLVAMAFATSALAVGACSSAGSTSSAPPVSASAAPTTGAPAAAAALTIKNFSFSPTPLAVRAGQAVSITNDDTTDHTATDNGGAFDTGHIAPGTTKTVTVTAPGTYHFHCNIHPTMMGEIDVSA
jgi:plastocyanin